MVWNLVHSTVLEAFAQLPAHQATIIRMENVGPEELRRLVGFFQLSGFDEHEGAIRSLLDVRVNASPGMGDDRSLNTWSKEISVADINAWSPAQREALVRWAGPLARRLYPEWMAQEFGPQ